MDLISSFCSHFGVQLTCLSLEDCDNITIGGLIVLSQLSQLKQLVLPASGNLPADAGLEYVMRLPRISNLDLSTCKNLPDEGAPPPPPLPPLVPWTRRVASFLGKQRRSASFLNSVSLLKSISCCCV